VSRTTACQPVAVGLNWLNGTLAAQLKLQAGSPRYYQTSRRTIQVRGWFSFRQVKSPTNFSFWNGEYDKLKLIGLKLLGGFAQ
jgi:hypothetical protein